MNNWVDEKLKNVPKLKVDKTRKGWRLYCVLDYCLDWHRKGTNALEFGVWEGKSIRRMANYFPKVYGFDSFEGLPETWEGVLPKGTFNLKGKLPIVPDNVELVKGLFNATLEKFLNEHHEPFYFIHIDCDIYSSTKEIFNILIKNQRLEKGCIIVFDELINYSLFMEGEMKALYEICQETDIKFEWIGSVNKVANSQDVLKEPFNKWTLNEFRNNGYYLECAIRITNKPKFKSI